MPSRPMSWILSAILLLPGQALAQTGEEVLTMSLDSLLGVTVNAAARHDQDSRDAPASVTVVTAEDIFRFGYQTVGEVLGGLPGFYNTHDRNYLYTGVRGFSRPGEYNNRVLLLVDGNPLNEPYWGSGPMGTDLALPLEVLERVEVVRGPGSALYGSNAMLAVVNLITKKGKDLNGIRTNGHLGSLGELQGSVSYGKEFSGGTDLVLVASGLRSEGESIYFPEFDEAGEDGVARDLDWDRSFGFRGVLQSGGVTLSVLGSHRKKAVPTAPWESLFNVESSSIDEWVTMEGVWERSLAPGRTLTIRGSLNRYLNQGAYAYDPEDGGDWYEESVSQWGGLEARHTWDISGGHRLVVGGEARRIWEASYTSWDISGPLGRIDKPFSVFSGFVQDELHLGRRLLLTLGARADKYGDREAELSPRVALVVQPTDGSSIKLLFGTAFRAPNRYELFYEDEGYHRRPETLHSERLQTFEVVWEQRVVDGLFTTLTAYQTEMDGFIDLEYDEDTEEAFFENFEGARSRGAEFGVLVRGETGLSARVSYGYALAEDLEYDFDLTNAPRHLARAAVSGPALLGIRPALEIRYDDARWTVYETQTESFLLTNLVFTTARSLGGVTGGLAVRNLLDQGYMLPGGWEHLQEAIPQTGRTIHLWFGFGF